MLELLEPDTVVLVVSNHVAQRLDGGFVVNELLAKEDLLVRDEFPREK